MIGLGFIVITGVVIFVAMVGYLSRMPDVSETAKTEVTAENNEEDAAGDNVEVATGGVVVKPLDWFNENQDKFGDMERAMVKKGCRLMSDEDAKELVKIRLEDPSMGVGCLFSSVLIVALMVFPCCLFGGLGAILLVASVPIGLVLFLIAFIVQYVHKGNVLKRNFIKVYPLLKGI